MVDGINDKYQYNPKQFLTEIEFISGINAGNKTVVSQAITLFESNHPSHRKLANKIISKLKNSSQPSIRIGITGGFTGDGYTAGNRIYGEYYYES